MFDALVATNHKISIVSILYSFTCFNIVLMNECFKGTLTPNGHIVP